MRKLYVSLFSILFWLGACAYSPTLVTVPTDNLACTLIIWYVDDAGDTIILGRGYSNDPLCPAPPAPVAPSNTTAAVASTSQINVSWADNSSDEQTFDVYRSLGPSGTFALVSQVSAGVTSYTDTGLPASTQFCYNVQAANANGSSTPSSTACATTATPTPGVPVLTATAFSSTQVNLSWSGVTATAQYVIISRRVGQAGTFSGISEFVASVTSFSDTGLTAGTEYCYQISQWPAPANPSNITCVTPG